jgi:hypothetical protein
MHVAHTVDEVLSGVDLTGKIFVITGATSGLGPDGGARARVGRRHGGPRRSGPATSSVCG